jgi:hypothetical protein
MFKKYFENSFAESKDLATKVLVDYTLGTPKYGADKSVELTAMDFEKDFITDFLPSMIYTFMYDSKIKESINGTEFIDRVPLLLCCTNVGGYISGINFNFLPNDIRASLLDEIYYAYKDFYTNTLSDAVTNGTSTFNKEFASFLIDEKTRQAFFKLMESKIGYPISAAYRKYNKEYIKNPRLVEFDVWKYIPCLVFKDAVRGVNLVDFQREIITNK